MEKNSNPVYPDGIEYALPIDSLFEKYRKNPISHILSIDLSLVFENLAKSPALKAFHFITSINFGFSDM